MKKTLVKGFILALLLVFTATVSFAGKPPTSTPDILPNDSNIQYAGRVDFTDPLAPVFGWGGNAITVNFQGTSIAADFSDTGTSDYVYIIIDDGTPVDLNLARGRTKYTLAGGLSDTVHKLQVVKKTEPASGHITFYGFYLDTGKALVAPPALPSLKLEFYGDSNPSGWACESPFDDGSDIYVNAYYAYPGQVARMLDAQYASTAWGGLGIVGAWKNVPEIWNRTLPNSATPVWNFSNYTPDAVIINLGANDYYYSCTQSEIMAGWEDFVTNYLRPVYPNAHIVFANSIGWAFNEPADYLYQTVDNLHNAGDTNVSYCLFPWLWGGSHAVVEEQAGFAQILADHLAVELSLPTPPTNPLNCLGGSGELFNGDFEITAIGNDRETHASGWRQWHSGGTTAVLTDAGVAYSGSRYAEISSGDAGYWQSMPVTVGADYTASAYIKATAGSTCTLRVEFKDQGQNVIVSNDLQHTVTGNWTQYTTVLNNAPANAWSVTVVLCISDSGTTVQYDNVTLVEN